MILKQEIISIVVDEPDIREVFHTYSDAPGPFRENFSESIIQSTAIKFFLAKSILL